MSSTNDAMSLKPIMKEVYASKKKKKAVKYADGGLAWKSDKPVSPELFDKINAYLKQNKDSSLSQEDRFKLAQDAVEQANPGIVDRSAADVLDEQDAEQNELADGIGDDPVKSALYQYSQPMTKDEPDHWDYTRDQELADAKRNYENDLPFNPEARTPNETKSEASFNKLRSMFKNRVK